MKENVRQAWSRVIAIQIVVALMATLAALLFGGAHGVSAFIGGFIAVVINGVFASKVFSGYRADQPARLVGGMYLAQLYKLILAGLLFGAAFAWLSPLNPGTLLGVFLVVYLASPIAAHKFGITL